MLNYITVRTFFKENKDRLKLKLITSDNGFNRKIATSDTHRPGLALAGFVDLFTYDRIQILGNTEILYLNSLSKKDLIKSIDRFVEFEIPCIIITNANIIVIMPHRIASSIPFFLSFKLDSICFKPTLLTK